MLQEPEVQIEDNLEDDSSEEVLPFRYSITSYGADYTVDGLVKRIGDGNIYVPTFQRGFVWTLQQASRFVESLLLGLPVPGIFLSKERGTQKLLVIDGQQRLSTLKDFYSGVFRKTRKEFALISVQKKFEGLTYKTLPDEDRRLLDDSILHATIIKQDEPSNDESSIYYIFERINTGGTKLQPQEIRTSIYRGSFCELLKSLNENSAWRSVYGSPSKNMRDQELILRFFALYFNFNSYRAPLKEFLNDYMGANKNLELQSKHQLTKAFEESINLIHECLGKQAFRPDKALNAAVFDAIMIGIAKRLERGDIRDCNTLKTKHQNLLENDSFVTAVTRSTADIERVSRRIKLATEAFADLE